MSRRAEQPDPSRERPAGWPTMFAFWLAPQWLILSLSLAHVPLWLGGPVRMDDLALPQLLCVQLILGAMLFPCLLRRRDMALVVILSSWPMIQLAAFVSATPPAQWTAAAAYLSLFLLAMALWAQALTGGTTRLIAAGLMNGWLLGGTLLVYLRAEFSGMSPTAGLWPQAGIWNPLAGLLGQLNPDASFWAWIPPLVLIITGAGWLIAGRKMRAHRR